MISNDRRLGSSLQPPEVRVKAIVPLPLKVPPPEAPAYAPAPPAIV